MTQGEGPSRRDPGQSKNGIRGTDPSSEYERLTGRSAVSDGLFGLVVALPAYLNQWMRTSLLSLVRELDEALDRKPSEVGEMHVDPPAPWTRVPLTWWCMMAQSGRSWPEVERFGLVPPAKVLQQILGDPPLRQACATFELARAMKIAGYVASQGLSHDGFPHTLMNAVASVVRAGGVEVDDPAAIPLGAAADLMEAARSLVADTREKSRKKAPKAGRHTDPVQMAFVLGVRCVRQPATPTAVELALLAAAVLLEPIESGQTDKATKRWGMRLKRSTKLGPLPALPQGAPPIVLV